MSRFPLKEKTLKIRDMDVRVRELTRGERNQFQAAVAEDRNRGPAIMASLGTIDPKMTEEEANGEPADVIEQIDTVIMELSGMKVGGKKDAEQKEPDAR